MGNETQEESKGLLSEEKSSHHQADYQLQHQYQDVASATAAATPIRNPQQRQGSNDSNGGERVCRNCHDDEGDDFIAPCLCTGSIRWVHRHCLDEWRSVSRNPNSFTQCDVCHFNYRFKDLSEDQKPWLKTKVALLITRDFLIMGLIFQALVWSCVGIMMAGSEQQDRDSWFPKGWAPMRVNYTAGLLLFLLLLGIASIIFAILKFCCGCFSASDYSYDTYPYYGGNWYCCWGCNTGYSSSHHHNNDCDSRGNCGSCNCGGGGGGGGGDGLLILAIVLIVIGAIAAVGMLAYFMTVSATYHIKHTYKRVETKVLVVADLATEGEMV